MSRYIDADKLKEKLDSFVSMNETYTDYNCGYDDCLIAVQDTLADIPTADVVEVRHGYWDINRNCSVCGVYKFEGLDADVWADWDIDYCPHCGAKMDGKDGE